MVITETKTRSSDKIFRHCEAIRYEGIVAGPHRRQNLSIDENGAETQEDLVKYKTVLIAKIEHMYVARNTRLHAKFRFNKAVR